jgi:DedD protein
MAKKLTEKELDLRRKTRRRLLGAIMLALAAVVILPMLLDGEPRESGSQNISLEIPSPDSVDKFVAVPPVFTTSDTLAEPVSPSSTLGIEENARVSKERAAEKVTKSVVVERKKVVGITEKQTDEMQKLVDKISGSGSEFVVQIGAFSSLDAAQRELDKVKVWRFRGYTEKVGDNVRVRVGPYPTRKRAENAVRRLKNHDVDSVVIAIK